MRDENRLIVPKQSWWEKSKDGVKDSSPQVKAALIAAGVTLFLALGGLVNWISVRSENTRLKEKIHDLEEEIHPFRNLAVQDFQKADRESLKKVAESMTKLRDDYAAQLQTVNTLRTQIDQLREANNKKDVVIADLRNKALGTTLMPDGSLVIGNQHTGGQVIIIAGVSNLVTLYNA